MAWAQAGFHPQPAPSCRYANGPLQSAGLLMCRKLSVSVSVGRIKICAGIFRPSEMHVGVFLKKKVHGSFKRGRI